MRRVVLVLIILITYSNLVLASDLKGIIENEVSEKSLIESCKFKSSGPDVVLQKTQSSVLIWLYEPDKEKFGDLRLASDVKEIGKNKYSFMINNDAYVVEGEIPDLCERLKETKSQRESIQTREVCGSPQTTISIFMEGRGYVCLYDISDPGIQPEQAILSTGILPERCPQEHCITISESIPSTEPIETLEPTNQQESRPQIDSQALANDINKALPKIAEFIRNLFNSIFGMKGCTRQPTKTPPLNPPVTSTTTEEKCNIEGNFKGVVDSQNIHIFVDASLLLPDVNTKIKNTKELNIEVKKQDDKALCGVPYKVTYRVNLQGSVLKYLGKTIIVSPLREANLLEIRDANEKLYDEVITKGIMGNGGVLVRMNNEKENYNYNKKRYDNPKYTLVELKRAFYDFIKSKEGQMNLGDWQTYEFEIIFELNSDKIVTATISEKMVDNKGRIFIKKEDTEKTVTEINIEDYKTYIKTIIDLIKSARDTMVFEGDISSEEGGYVVISGGGYNIKDNIGKLNGGDTVPGARGVSETKMTIKNEKVEKEQLKHYLDLTK